MTRSSYRHAADADYTGFISLAIWRSTFRRQPPNPFEHPSGREDAINEVWHAIARSRLLQSKVIWRKGQSTCGNSYIVKRSHSVTRDSRYLRMRIVPEAMQT